LRTSPPVNRLARRRASLVMLMRSFRSAPRTSWRFVPAALASFVLLSLLAVSTSQFVLAETGTSDNLTAAATAPAKPAAKPAGIRNVIIMIGDGMGPQQVGLLTQYAKYAKGST